MYLKIKFDCLLILMVGITQDLENLSFPQGPSLYILKNKDTYYSADTGDWRLETRLGCAISSVSIFVFLITKLGLE